MSRIFAIWSWLRVRELRILSGILFGISSTEILPGMGHGASTTNTTIW